MLAYLNHQVVFAYTSVFVLSCFQPVSQGFRLFVCVPAGILIQHGLRVTCEATANFRSTLQKSYRSTAFLLNKWHTADKEVDILWAADTKYSSLHKHRGLTFALCCSKTFFAYIVGENSPILSKRNFYTTFTMGENSLMIFTRWNCHGVHREWKFIHDFNKVNCRSVDFVAICQNCYFTNILDFSSIHGEKKYW